MTGYENALITLNAKKFNENDFIHLIFHIRDNEKGVHSKYRV